MNNGVVILPWSVCKIPVRAEVEESDLFIVNNKFNNDAIQRLITDWLFIETSL